MDVFLLALLFVSGCGKNNRNNSNKTNNRWDYNSCRNYHSSTDPSLTLEGDWKAVDFRDTVERTFLIYYGDANSRLKVTEAFQDIVPTLKITGTDVTYSYSADMNKYIDFCWIK